MNETILIVDDEVKITEILKAYLEKAGYMTRTAFTGKDAIEIVEKEHPDFMILDLMLPDISDEEVCRTLRKTSNIPIIMLTAKAEEMDIVHGLEYGADDYIIKSFSPRNVVARVEAVFRRCRIRSPNEDKKIILDGGCLVIELDMRRIQKDGKEVHLTPTEYKLFELMVLAPNRIFSREQLISFALEDTYEGFDRSIDTHIKHIRHKIESDRKNPKHFVTVFGVGYKFVP